MRWHSNNANQAMERLSALPMMRSMRSRNVAIRICQNEHMSLAMAAAAAAAGVWLGLMV